MFRYSCIIAFNTTFEWVATYTFYQIYIVSSDGFFHHRLYPFPNSPGLHSGFPPSPRIYQNFDICFANLFAMPWVCQLMAIAWRWRVEGWTVFCGCAEWWNFDPYFRTCLYPTSIETVALNTSIQVPLEHASIESYRTLFSPHLISKTPFCRNVRCWILPVAAFWWSFCFDRDLIRMHSSWTECWNRRTWAVKWTLWDRKRLHAIHYTDVSNPHVIPF